MGGEETVCPLNFALDKLECMCYSTNRTKEPRQVRRFLCGAIPADGHQTNEARSRG